MTKQQIQKAFNYYQENHNFECWVKTLKNFRLPKFNDKPQIWLRGSDYNQGLRIIYPNGKVEFTCFNSDSFDTGCTGGKTQQDAVLNCISYDMFFDGTSFRNNKPVFIGYID
jgi:hypothetical protein